MKPKILIVLTLTLLLVSQCELFLGESEKSTITIDLWGPGSAEESSARWISAPPAGIISYTVTVSAPDMKTIQKTVLKGTRYITMDIPTGQDRTIRLDANLDPNGPSALLSFAGEKTIDLYPGRIIKLIFLMIPGETKLVIPDASAWRLVQIPSISPDAADWKAITQVVNEGSGANLLLQQPWTVDFDSQGRIFILNRSPESIIRIDYFNPSPGTTYGIWSYPMNMNGLAVDRINDVIYYDTYSALTRQNLDLSDTPISMTPPTGVTSFTSLRAEGGILYILGYTTVPTLFRYVPATGATTHRYFQTGGVSDPYFDSPRDLLVKGNYVYVSNWNSGKIARFTKDTLTPINAAGTKTSSPNDNTPGNFYGPHHFIAPTNRKFYLIDDAYSSGNGSNRIVSFEDITAWTDWDSFRAEDIGESEFLFYYFC